LPEEIETVRQKLLSEFKKLKELLKYTKEYFESVKAIITKFINEYSTEQELNDVITQLKEIEKMITYIESSFNTKRIERVKTNNEELATILEETEGKLKF
jgi:DNA repair protein RadC